MATDSINEGSNPTTGDVDAQMSVKELADVKYQTAYRHQLAKRYKEALAGYNEAIGEI